MEKRMVPLDALRAERKKLKLRMMQMQEQIQNMEIQETSSETNAPINDYLVEFANLVKNPYYADSSEHVQELTEYAKAHDVPLKTAYNALFAEKKYEELKNMASSPAIRVEAVESGSAPAPVAVKLTDEQLFVAGACGISPQEYAEYM